MCEKLNTGVSMSASDLAHYFQTSHYGNGGCVHDVLEEVRNGAHWFDVLIDCNNFGAFGIAPSGK